MVDLLLETSKDIGELSNRSVLQVRGRGRNPYHEGYV